MTVEQWLRHATHTLQDAGIESARLDCLVLLEDVLNTNRTQILAHPEMMLTEAKLALLEDMLSDRSKHVPLAYLRGKVEFYGREFAVTKHVLVPRPESEAMIELLKEISPPPGTIIDVGTGSGALACTAQLELPTAKVIAVDIDNECLDATQQNAMKYGLSIDCRSSDLLTSLPPTLLFGESGCTLLCNLPYVPVDYPINAAAEHEPALALFGGTDGLDLYRKLFSQASQHPAITNILCESLMHQHGELTKIAQQHGWQQSGQRDLVQNFVRTTE